VADDSVREEAHNFLSEAQENMSRQHKIALEGVEMDNGDQEVALSDEIIPSFEKTDIEKEENPEDQGRPRKNKVWGHVQATRKSSRVDRSMNVMKNAIEYKRGATWRILTRR
jgi:hypothetical protein